jgi:CheY-like chemotaxis protein
MKKVLIVDDSESFLELVELMLKDDFDLSFAKSSTEAIGLVRNGSFDGIILDMSLPDYTGYYLGEKIRKSLPNVPIAILTNYNGEISRENADIIRAKFWYKPNVAIDKKVLVENVKKLVNNV